MIIRFYQLFFSDLPPENETNGYVFIHAEGGLNQQRIAVCIFHAFISFSSCHYTIMDQCPNGCCSSCHRPIMDSCPFMTFVSRSAMQ